MFKEEMDMLFSGKFEEAEKIDDCSLIKIKTMFVESLQKKYRTGYLINLGTLLLLHGCIILNYFLCASDQVNLRKLDRLSIVMYGALLIAWAWFKKEVECSQILIGMIENILKYKHGELQKDEILTITFMASPYEKIRRYIYSVTLILIVLRGVLLKDFILLWVFLGAMLIIAIPTSLVMLLKCITKR